MSCEHLPFSTWKGFFFGYVFAHVLLFFLYWGLLGMCSDGPRGPIPHQLEGALALTLIGFFCGLFPEGYDF